MGSPQMNFLDAQIVEKGNNLIAKIGDNDVVIPAAKAKVLKESGYVGKTVVLGIRPEDIDDDPEFIEKHSNTTFEAQIKVYELLGAEVNLHYDIADVTCTAKVNPRTTARPGDTIKMAMDVSRLHVFDKETEQIITH